MIHPWKEKRPLSAWYPAGYSEYIGGKCSRNMRPVLDKEKCVMCSLCWIYCPEGCIDRSKGFMEINMTYCRGCGICAVECSKNAYEMIREG